jgi:serine/threonine protein kinase
MDYREVLQTDTVLDRKYRIDRVIGAGGFGITYQAYDIGLASPVAIKEYYPAQFGMRDASMSVRPRTDGDRPLFDRLRSSFLREARTLAKFDHPAIVRVLSVFEAHGTAYMVMKYESGPSLKVWLQELGRAPTQAELDRLVWPLLDALEAMHRSDFLHRDIAPDNIIVRADGSPVLLDFGASRQVITDMSGTLTGVVKQGYSPQEQYSSDVRAQGPWTDIYALGATLYLAVTGRVPTEATARMLEDGLKPSMTSARTGYRSTFLAAIDAAMRLHPRDRPQSVAAWRESLFAAYASGAEVEARDAGSGDARLASGVLAPATASRTGAVAPSQPRPGPDTQSRRSGPPAATPATSSRPSRPAAETHATGDGRVDTDIPTSQPLLARATAFALSTRGAMALGVGAMLLGGGMLVALEQRGGRAPAAGNAIAIDSETTRRQQEAERHRLNEETQRRAQEQAERQRLASLEVQRKAKEDADRRAREEAERRRLAEEAERKRLADLEAQRKAKEDADRRAREEAERRRLAEEAERKRLAELEAQRKAKEDADRRAREEAERRRLAEEAERKRLADLEAQRKAKEPAAGSTPPPPPAQVAPRKANIRQTSFAAGAQGGGLYAQSVAIAPGIVVAAGTGGHVRLWTPEQGPARALAAQHRSQDAVSAIALSTDQRQFATGTWGGEIRLWTTRTGEAGRRIEDPRNKAPIAALGYRTETRLIAIRGNGGWNIIDPTRGTIELSSAQTAERRVTAAEVARGGRLALVALADAPGEQPFVIEGWEPANAGATNVTGRLIGHRDWIYAVTISGNGASIASASADGTVRLWDWPAARERLQLAGHGAHVRALAFSPDGARVAGAGDDGRVVIWRTDTGAVVSRLDGEAGTAAVRALAFGTDGRSLTLASEDGELRQWTLDGTP